MNTNIYLKLLTRLKKLGCTYNSINATKRILKQRKICKIYKTVDLSMIGNIVLTNYLGIIVVIRLKW